MLEGLDTTDKDGVGKQDTGGLSKAWITSKMGRAQRVDHSLVSPRNSVIWLGIQI